MTKKANKAPGHWHSLSFKQLVIGIFTLVGRNKKQLVALTLIYMTLFFVFSQGLSAIDVSTLKEEISTDLGIEPSSAGGRVLLATLVFESAGAQDDFSATYLLFISIIISLAYIWLLRHAWAKKKTSVKEAFYQGMYPLVKFMAVVGIGIIQLIPVALGVYLLGLALQGGDILISTPEIIGGYLVLLVLPALWSLSMLIKTIFALIITTIPDMKPLEAYSAAKDLLKQKKAYVAKHFVILVTLLLVTILSLLLLSIALVPTTTAIIGMLSSAILLPIFVVFTYTLYRSLIGE